jgi:tetratricopeptide (TPR) repeat protein
MAEEMLGGILGEEEERPEVESPEALAGAEAFTAAMAAKFAAAVAVKLAGNDPGVARKTEVFLDKQAQLLEIQAQHLKDEHDARLHFLQGQAREVDLRRFGLRLRVSFQLLLALLATAIGIGLLVMVRDAVTSRSVVIDSFDAPPALAANGLSGKVVAAGLLDVLTRIQAANRSGVEQRALSNAWTNEISIEVPETGISIGQIERMLKTRFGHDQHIDGDLVQTETGGLLLTVRGSGVMPKSFVDGTRNLEKLLTQAGEYVYGQSQPGLWTAYLSNNDRDEEAIRFAQSTYITADLSERPYILNYWANAIADGGGVAAARNALSLYREAIRLNPDYWNGYHNVMDSLFSLGDEEAIVETGKQLMKRAGGRPGRAPEFYYENYDLAVWDLPAAHSSAIADMESHHGVGTTTFATGPENLNVAAIEVQMHDVESAEFRLKTTPIDQKNRPDVATAADARALLAEERGDLKEAAREWDSFAMEYVDPVVSSTGAQFICYAAVTYEKTGQPAKADAALNAVGKVTLVDCYRFRGDVLDLRGDWAAAQEWYAKAVKLAPSIPSGYYSWGVALAKHGDLDGAAAKFRDANQKGPHWADPLKTWGDVLVKQSNTKEALAKYDEALKYAPNWKQLKEAREATAKKT